MSAPVDKISELLHSILLCISDVKVWTTVNMLKLNDVKKELMFGPVKKNSASPLPAYLVGYWQCSKSFQSVKNLSFPLDCHLTMREHFSIIAWMCYFELHHLTSIYRFLTNKTVFTLVSTFVL